MALEFGLDKGRPISPDEIAVRQRQRRIEVLDEVCRKFKLTPHLLSRQPEAELVRMVKAVIGEGKPVSPARIQAYVKEYLAVKS